MIDKPSETFDMVFGDMSRKATVYRWGKQIMVEVVSEDDTRAIVQYGVDPETNAPELMQVDKVKDAYRRLTPQEARGIVQEALAHAFEGVEGESATG